MAQHVSKIRFDAAFEAVLKLFHGWLKKNPDHHGKVVLVRDVYGQFRVVFECSLQAEACAGLAGDMRQAVGAYLPSETPILFKDDLVAPTAIFESPDLWQPRDTIEDLWVLDRQITGREWLLSPLENEAPSPPRAVFFGLKGGVGRTTALTVLAWYLSRLDKKVLVVDLDLESPGLGSIMLPPLGFDWEQRLVAGWPEFGVVDWFVEDAVGQADDRLIADMLVSSPLTTNGEVLVAPACGGVIQQDYVSKLSRAYLDVPHAGKATEMFGNRLARMLDQLEKYVQPDVVLLDCRAGLHDISSVALTRLGATNYLFGIDTRQTWEGYRHLFHHWLRKPELAREVRTRLRMVAAMTPESAPEAVFRRGFSDRAYGVFQALYDEAAIGADEEVFHPAPEDGEAPHAPSLIRFMGDFAQFNPLTNSVQLEERKVDFAFGDFLFRATLDLLGADAL